MAQQLLKFAASKLEESLESEEPVCEAIDTVPEEPDCVLEGEKQEAEDGEKPEESLEPKGKAKAKAKAKAKTEPKPKAKGKAKAKAKAEEKGETSASKKRKSQTETKSETGQPDTSETGQPDTDEKPAKLTAAARLKKRADDLLTEEEPADKEPAEEEQQLCERRDKRKTRFFQSNLKQLPESVQKLFLSSEVSRTDKTRLVNESVQLNPKSGKWEFACSPPVFESLTSCYSSVTGATRDKAYPKAIMIGKCAGEEKFLRGLRDGDIEATTENGKQLFKFRCLEVTSVTGVRSETKHKKEAEAAADPEAETHFLGFCENFNPELDTDFLDPKGALLNPQNVNRVPLEPQPLSATPAWPAAAPAAPAASSASKPLFQGPLAICDGAVDLMPAEPKTLAKVEDALNWIASAKQATMKLKKNEDSVTYTHLKQQLDCRWLELLPLQAQLEHVKLSGKASVSGFRLVMKQVSQCLLQVQELIKSIAALN